MNDENERSDIMGRDGNKQGHNVGDALMKRDAESATGSKPLRLEFQISEELSRALEKLSLLERSRNPETAAAHVALRDALLETQARRIEKSRPAKEISSGKKPKSQKSSRFNWGRPAGPRTVAKAEHALDLLSALVPQRIASEEIGDAVEVIHQMVKAGRPKWFVALKVSTTFFWVGVHTLLHYAERVAGIVSLARGKGDKD
jgi:hypothetical protein